MRNFLFSRVQLKSALYSMCVVFPLMAMSSSVQASSEVTILPTSAAMPQSSAVSNFYTASYTATATHPKIALVLGSGGARGYAHIGVIKVLEQYGIKPDFIVGTSAGSIVGALYASGKTATQLEQVALDLKASDVRDFTLSKQGFFDGQKIENYINQQVENTALQQMQIPLYVVATELKTGRETVFYQGNTGKAVRASTSIPSMFVPTKIGDEEYVDGGLVSPVPVEVAKRLGADIIIAVDILARPEHTETSNMWGLFNQNINVMQTRLAQYEAAQADILIRPDIREKQHVFSTDARVSTIQAGETSALEQVARVKQLMERWQPTVITQNNMPHIATKLLNNVQYLSSD